MSAPYPEATDIANLLQAAQHVLILQAENPDADSLGSALALEQILGEQGKKTTLFCSVDVPGYLRYLEGWDRVVSELPGQFDASIIVDASTLTLFEKLTDGNRAQLSRKPCIVLDHHQEVSNTIPFATVRLNDHTRSSTGELLVSLAEGCKWKLDATAGTFLMTAILGDTQGLSNPLTSAETYRIMAQLTDLGVDRQLLEERRREFSKLPPKIYTYKAELIKRTEFYADNQLALVSVPQAEITEYSPLYNPAPLIQGDMLQVSSVELSVVLKHYADGKVTAAIRANPAAPVAAELAEHFGGGGHQAASGFKVTDGRPFNEIKSECISKATELLTNLKRT